MNPTTDDDIGPGTAVRSQLGRLPRTAFAFAVSAGLMWWAFHGVRFHEMRQILLSADAGWLAVAYAVVLAAGVVHCCRWAVLLNVIGGSYRFSQLLRVHFAGLLCNLVLPAQLGIDAARIQFARMVNVRRTQMVAVVVVDRIMGVLTVSILGLLSWMLFYRNGMPGWIAAVPAALFCGSLTAIVVVACLNQRNLRRIANFIPAGVVKARLLEGIDRTRLKGDKLRVVETVGLAATVQCALMALALGTIAHALHLPAHAFVIGAALPLIASVTMLPISINSLGVREAMFRITLISVGLTQSEAMTVATVWLAMVVLSALPGVFGLVSLSGHRESAKSDPSPGGVKRDELARPNASLERRI